VSTATGKDLSAADGRGMRRLYAVDDIGLGTVHLTFRGGDR
jgi:hypothetical protein